MTQNKISQTVELASASPHQVPMEAEERDINRLNAEGVVYAGYHVNHDELGNQRHRLSRGLA